MIIIIIITVTVVVIISPALRVALGQVWESWENQGPKQPTLEQFTNNKTLKNNNKKIVSTDSAKKGFPKINMRLIDKAFEIATSEEEETYISKVGTSLRKIDPSFDSRTYGFKTLTQLFESIGKYIIVKNEVNGLNHPLVKLK